ncbi:MAG: DNA cytosine methyltransferase [Wolinella sp.]
MIKNKKITKKECLNELALFAGLGGGIQASALLRWRTLCAVECDSYARNVLIKRQNTGDCEPFPIWDDVRTFRGEPWRGIIDVVSGGFPCQDISIAGKGAGLSGERSGLWREMARIIKEVEPRYVFVENSPMLRSRGLREVLYDLASMGYDTRWGILGAYHLGAPHKRERIWIFGEKQEASALSHSYSAKRTKRDKKQRILKSRRNHQLTSHTSCPIKS